MKIFKSRYKLQKKISNNSNISFVPTMGGLHEGHISLIKRAKKIKGNCLVSIFVNPKQFNNIKDFKRYHRDIKKDLRILTALKVDYLYIPSYEDVFLFRPKCSIFVNKFSKKLCGKFRKGHFEGVLDVVNRFLEIIKPKSLLLGEKDYQQLYLIHSHIKKRKIKTKVIPSKSIRNKNGVVFSTRNKNIDNKQLKIASRVYHYLKNKKLIINKNFLLFNRSMVKKDLLNIGLEKIEYIELLNIKTMKKLKHNNEKFKIFIAYYLGGTRFIDNI